MAVELGPSQVAVEPSGLQGIVGFDQDQALRECSCGVGVTPGQHKDFCQLGPYIYLGFDHRIAATSGGVATSPAKYI